MKRGHLVAVVVVEMLVAAAFALVLAFIAGFATGFGQVAAHWHGPVPPPTPEDQAEVRAASLAAFAGCFVVMFGSLLALTAGVLALIRHAKRQPGHRPKPRSVSFLTASFTYSIFATVPLAFWAFLGHSALEYLYVGTQLVASATGLWFALTPQAVSRVVITCAALLLCLASWLTSPLWGPGLIIWPAAVVLLAFSKSMRLYFDGLAPLGRTA